MECLAVRDYTSIHHMIRGLIRLVESAISAAKPDNAKHMKTLSELGLFTVAGTHLHHKSEDAFFWPAIEVNGADPSLLAPLIEEHKQLDPLLAEIDSEFAASASGSVTPTQMATLQDAFGRFRDHMLSHLDDEEPVFFPLLTEFMPDDQAQRLNAEVAKLAPRKGLSWLMGAVEYAMTTTEASEFLGNFPKPVQWLRPVMVRKYRKDCAVLGVDPAIPSPGPR